MSLFATPDGFIGLHDKERAVVTTIEDRLDRMAQDPDYRRHVSEILAEVDFSGSGRMTDLVTDALLHEAIPVFQRAVREKQNIDEQELSKRFRDALAQVFGPAYRALDLEEQSMIRQMLTYVHPGMSSADILNLMRTTARDHGYQMDSKMKTELFKAIAPGVTTILARNEADNIFINATDHPICQERLAAVFLKRKGAFFLTGDETHV